MQYPVEQVGQKLAAQLEKDGIARIFPLVDFEQPTGKAWINELTTGNVPEMKSEPAPKPKKKGR